PVAARHPPVLVRAPRRAHRLRGARLVSAGLHLHDPHRRVHRRCHASRALRSSSDPRPRSDAGHHARSHGHRSRDRVRRGGHRPRHRHRARRRQRHHGDVAAAGVGGHGPHHHVPRHRVHRSARALRVRARLHHLGLREGSTMRIRNLVLASVLGVALVVAGAGAAFADTTPSSSSGQSNPGVSSNPPAASNDTTGPTAGKPAGKAEEDCIKLLEEGKKIDECQKAPSLITPEKNELIWGIISFVLLFLALWKFAWPGLKNGLAARTDRIKDDLDAAETAKTEAEQVLAEYRSQLTDARNESARIIEEARQQADALRREQEQRLQTELAAMRERAAADIESAKAQAVADLRTEVATLAIGAAEVIVQRNLDRSAQENLVDQYINQVLTRSN